MEQEASDDASLIRATLAGSDEAFGELYLRYRRMVHAVALARVGAAEADDVVQEVFVIAIRKLASLRDSAALGGWLATIARNCAAAVRRSATEHDEITEHAVAAGQEEDEEARRALAAIRSLPEAYRETLMMRLVEGMTGPEIAARTGLTPDSVRVNLHRGMRLLREMLETRR